ncbi:peptide chain release factor aRF-1 [Candidatus Woesearchaeota archaeon]|nr:peptide chain release factor aRF-1 [Candidatus Woesearchaeota archaeon]
MVLSAKQRHDLKKFLDELNKYKGRHTELVSVYVPAGYDMNKVINHLQQEQGTATNIKSASTRKNVIAALERMIQHLRVVGKTPENGLAAFSGNVAEREGQQDLKVWSVEPPVPLKIRIYRCDKEFILEPIDRMLEHKEIYGLVVMDRRDATIAFLKGKSIIPLIKTHSEVPGKFRAGGQSAQRFERIIEGAAKQHYKKVADKMKDQFFGRKKLKGIIIGGPGHTKYDFVEGGFLTAELKNKIIGIKDLSYTGEFGLQELLEKSQDILAKEDVAAEKKIMGRFFELLAKKPKMVSYGRDVVMKLLKMGAVEVLLISESADDQTIDEFEIEAQKFSTEVKLISTETREGVQLKEMGTIAAILRYEAE